MVMWKDTWSGMNGRSGKVTLVGDQEPGASEV